uniref:uncharacterized protein LOC125413167 n=1 Tax=Myodes glareolus TaxID=447135 RepID=UPI002021627F|nr:uncharacterized protein LOC125413167 [Myodes glareolus]
MQKIRTWRSSNWQIGRYGARSSRKFRLGQLLFWRAAVTYVGRVSLLLPPVNSLAGRPAAVSGCVSGPWGTAWRPEAGARALEGCLHRNGETEVQRRPAPGFRAVPGAPGAAVSRLPALAGPAASRKASSPGEKGRWSLPAAARGAGTALWPEAAALPKERSFIPLLHAGHNCSPDITAPVCLGPGEVQPVWVPARCCVSG